MATHTAINATPLPGLDARHDPAECAVVDAPPISRAGWAGVAASLGLLGLLFGANLRHFVLMWQTDENYGHGFLVPFIALYFAREAAHRGPLPAKRGVGFGLAMLAVAIVG